jgi:hypothetical protein
MPDSSGTGKNGGPVLDEPVVATGDLDDLDVR